MFIFLSLYRIQMSSTRLIFYENLKIFTIYSSSNNPIIIQKRYFLKLFIPKKSYSNVVHRIVYSYTHASIICNFMFFLLLKNVFIV